MVIRLKKIHKQFVLLIGLGLFLVLSLHLMPTYLAAQDSVLLALNVRTFDNTTRAFHNHKQRKLTVWDAKSGQDRIVEQLRYKPYVDTSLPRKTILVENGVMGWSIPAGNAVFVDQQCQVQHCDIVDRRQEGILYDARMFKEIDISKLSLPLQLDETKRHADQVWIMFALESPQASPEYDGLENAINWTATYRPDSTIVTPYEKWVPFDNFTGIETLKPTKNYAAGKTKMGAMFVSNCPTQNNRLEYVHELQKFIDVDIFGSCGDKRCDKNSANSCFNMLSNDYKFYFAFENANCRYYITEKLFLNALRNNVLPVVMGARPDDYERVAPPGSYIHVEDFNGPEELATYLKKLASNDEEYNMYFRWRDTGSFINTKFWCRICSMLWSPERPNMSVPDLDSWWRGGDTCIGAKKWSDLKKEASKASNE